MNETTNEIPAEYVNQIVTGDARELARRLPDQCMDLIFTDPPYLREYIPLYGWLAQEAARVLKPGGLLMAYAGVYWKWDVMQLMSEHMDYWLEFVSLNSGNSPIIWSRRVISRHKGILAYARRGDAPRGRVMPVSVWRGGGQDKRFHTWGQDESTARYYVDCFSEIGDVIWDPFVGGGTTCEAARLLSRNFIAFEIDPGQADIARARLAHPPLRLFVPEMVTAELTLEAKPPELEGGQ